MEINAAASQNVAQHSAEAMNKLQQKIVDKTQKLDDKMVDLSVRSKVEGATGKVGGQLDITG